jgi:NADPH:quinone reductase-like Zn-dependent oxidoreductase
MKAAVCTKYGPPGVLMVKEVSKPVPRDNEVLVKVRAAAVTISDCYVRSGKVNPLLWIPMRIYVGFLRPRNPILGFDLAGEVEAIGKNIKHFNAGDEVIAFTGKSFGAYAEYNCLPEDGLSFPADCIMAIKPANLTFEEAAAVPGRGILALHFTKKGNIRSGQKVLIYGASGAIGTFAVQLAKYFGAEVTGVCSTGNLGMVKSLGADKVIDYTKTDFTESGEHYDFIFDVVPAKKINRKVLRLKCGKVLAPDGKYMSIDDETPKSQTEDLNLLKQIIESGKIKPFIDKVYTLEQIAEAHSYVEQGHKKGNIVIAFNH